MSEAKIQNKIRIALSKAGYVNFRANVGKVKQADGRYFDTGLPVGFSDLFGCTPEGKMFFIEVKSETGRVRPEQEKFLERMELNGALVGVARSVEDALRIVQPYEDRNMVIPYRNR